MVAPFQLNYSCFRLLYRTDLVAQIVFLITPWHGPSRKPYFKQYLYRASIRSCGDVFVCNCHLATTLVYQPISRSLHSNSSTCHNTAEQSLIPQYKTILHLTFSFGDPKKITCLKFPPFKIFLSLVLNSVASLKKS
jgi:hypothetical protein